MRNELKTGENESMQENENDLFMDWVPLINKRIMAHGATRAISAHNIHIHKQSYRTEVKSLFGFNES